MSSDCKCQYCKPAFEVKCSECNFEKNICSEHTWKDFENCKFCNKILCESASCRFKCRQYDYDVASNGRDSCDEDVVSCLSCKRTYDGTPFGRGWFKRFH